MKNARRGKSKALAARAALAGAAVGPDGSLTQVTAAPTAAGVGDVGVS